MLELRKRQSNYKNHNTPLQPAHTGLAHILPSPSVGNPAGSIYVRLTLTYPLRSSIYPITVTPSKPAVQHLRRRRRCSTRGYTAGKKKEGGRGVE